MKKPFPTSRSMTQVVTAGPRAPQIKSPTGNVAQALFAQKQRLKAGIGVVNAGLAS